LLFQSKKRASRGGFDTGNIPSILWPAKLHQQRETACVPLHHSKNLCIDTYRKADEQPLPEDIAIDDAGIATLETSIAVKQAVASLPDDIQEILLLRYSNELSVKEICEVTGLSRFAVRRKINGGLETLKLILREDDFS